MFVDSHCHLDRLDYEKKHQDIADVVNKAMAKQVKHLLSVSVTQDAFPAMLEAVLPFDNVFASCGVHPLDLDSAWTVEQLSDYAKHPRVVAIGETGLDYYYSTDNKAEQQQAFREHIRLSRSLNKPVIVHTRDAKADTLNILKEEQAADAGGVLHCFTEDWEMAKAALDLGLYISISGIVTFRNADALREVTKQIPMDRLLIETDSPYLAPVPHRGHQNEPAYVADVAAFIANLKGITLEELAVQTTDNFFKLFSQAQR